jgi:glutaredoxin
VALTCGEPPAGHCKGTLRLLADKMVELEYVEKVSHETVRDTLKKMKLSLGKKKNGASLQNPMQNSFVKWKKS